MAGAYRHRYLEKTGIRRLLLHYLERFLAGYEERFNREYGFLGPIVKQVVERIRILLRLLCLILPLLFRREIFSIRADFHRAS